MVRLNASIEAIQERLRNRHEPDSSELFWHMHRSVKLNEILNLTQLDTHVLAIGSQEPKDVAQAVRALIGW